MKIQLISDIHLEFYNEDIDIKFVKSVLTPSSPYLAICGDLGYPHRKQYEQFLSICSILFEKVFVILGNHEYYNSNSTTFTMDEIKQAASNIINKYKNIFLLDNDIHHLEEENICIIGTTLWSQVYKKIDTQNDYHKIHIKDEYYLKNISISDTNKFFHNNVQYLKNTIEEHKNHKLIILSHFLPSHKLIDPRYKNHEANEYFVTDIEYLIADNVLLWLCGHSHSNIKTVINNCTLAINAYGYKNETKNRVLDFTLEIN